MRVTPLATCTTILPSRRAACVVVAISSGCTMLFSSSIVPMPLCSNKTGDVGKLGGQRFYRI